MTKYINCRTNQGIETIDCIDRKKYKTKKEFVCSVFQHVRDYQLSGHDAYVSTRATKEWYNR